MDDEWKQLALGVRLDTRGFAAEVQAIRDCFEGPLEQSADRVGRAIEASLLRAARTGKLEFGDLKKVALSAMDAIAAAALKAGIAAIRGGGGGSGSGGGGGGSGGDGGGCFGTGLGQLLMGVLSGGLPGRATGGPVSPARAYMVGERGPEMFVPTAAGRVEASVAPAAREVRVAISINAPAGESPAMLQRSGRQVARAVRAALSE